MLWGLVAGELTKCFLIHFQRPSAVLKLPYRFLEWHHGLELCCLSSGDQLKHRWGPTAGPSLGSALLQLPPSSITLCSGSWFYYLFSSLSTVTEMPKISVCTSAFYWASMQRKVAWGNLVRSIHLPPFIGH
jgi:hypothetical protein